MTCKHQRLILSKSISLTHHHLTQFDDKYPAHINDYTINQPGRVDDYCPTPRPVPGIRKGIYRVVAAHNDHAASFTTARSRPIMANPIVDNLIAAEAPLRLRQWLGAVCGTVVVWRARSNYTRKICDEVDFELNWQVSTDWQITFPGQDIVQ